jgi:hypothetical protein
MTFSMDVHFEIVTHDPEDEPIAEELRRGWQEATDQICKELRMPVEIDKSLAVDLGAMVHETLQMFAQLKRRAAARMPRGGEQ